MNFCVQHTFIMSVSLAYKYVQGSSPTRIQLSLRCHTFILSNYPNVPLWKRVEESVHNEGNPEWYALDTRTNPTRRIEIFKLNIRSAQVGVITNGIWLLFSKWYHHQMQTRDPVDNKPELEASEFLGERFAKQPLCEKTAKTAHCSTAGHVMVLSFDYVSSAQHTKTLSINTTDYIIDRLRIQSSSQIEMGSV